MFRISLAGVVMLVLLRVTIGWHFLYQGIGKLESANFSSSGFLSQAKGPLADRFHELIPDFWGRERLDEKNAIARLDADRAALAQKFTLSESQAALADRVVAARKEQISDFFAENKDDIETYFHELERFEAAKTAPNSELDFQRKRNWDKQQELQAKLKGWVKQLDAWQQEARRELSAVVNKTPDVVPSLLDRSGFSMDQLVTYSNIAIGLCLIAGLFSRLAAFGGALFLLSIVLAQPELPGLYPPAPPAAGRSLIVNKEFVEMMALFALAALPVGRWGGLDFFIHHLVTRPLFGKREQGLS
ncbi:MAG: hypothetical protein K1X71_00385 [Pirellulales bacterium]|nr:hypothetical protein [Pirellulales bacterium]